jgi:hypothetical protein
MFAGGATVASGVLGLPDDLRAWDADVHAGDDEPDPADVADADDAVGVLDRWVWFDDPRADDWWVGDALKDVAADQVAEDCADEADGADDDGADGPDDDGADGAAGRWPWASAAFLEHALPGAGLAQLLELADPGDLDDAALVESAAAWERLAAWAHLGAALSAGELSRRASMNPRWARPVPAQECVAGDELAMRLGWSRPAAGRLVRDGRALAAQLLPVADAVREGLLDTSKLRVLTDRLHDRAYQLSWPVLDQVLPEAPLRTPTQLAADVDRALLAVEPEDAAVRLPKALATRHVCHPRRLPDGMAGLWAVLPADDAARIDATLEATARAARALGNARTLDQLRADTLTGLATGDALLAGAAIQEAATQMTAGRDSHATVDEMAGGADGGRGGGVPGPGRKAPGIRIPKIRVDVTVALSTLMGLDERPGEVAGLGPIPAEQARALAAGGVWRRLVTDPLTGAVLDVGRARYRPPAGLAEHVRARDGSCAAPGCTVPSHRCDLDHTTEFYGAPANGSSLRGTTSAGNLGPLSDRCHRLKTDGGFVLRQVEPGVFEWRTPAGMAYRVIPGERGRAEKLSARRSGYPEVPPF